MRAYRRDWYNKNKQRSKENVRKRRRAIREWFLGFKKTFKCVKCGESDPRCLDFHHRDSKSKFLEVSVLVGECWSPEKIKNEIYKCDAVCANCHRKITSIQNRWFYDTGD